MPVSPAKSFDAFFYEAFAEEAERLLHHAAQAGLRAGHTPLTIQEAGHAAPAPVISLRTQSILPPAWAGQVRGILSRSTGYDHLLAYRAAVGAHACPPLGYLPLYCVRAVAEQALLLWTALLRRLPRQLAEFDRFRRGGSISPAAKIPAKSWPSSGWAISAMKSGRSPPPWASTCAAWTRSGARPT